MESLSKRINQNTELFISEFEGLSEELLNMKPSAERWSIAENIQHLIVLNQSYFPIFEELEAGTYSAPWHHRIGFLVSFFGKQILSSVQPDSSKKIKTFPIWEPSSSKIETGILEAFKKHHEALKEKLPKIESWISRDQVINSPASRMIVYRLETAMELILQHELRHLEQAREQLKTIRAN